MAFQVQAVDSYGGAFGGEPSPGTYVPRVALLSSSGGVVVINGTKWPSRAFFLIGAPRCGTTSLALALAQHPQVCFSEPKEPHFFTHVSESFDSGRLEAEYIRAFFRADRMSRDALGEASPSYLYSPQAIRAIDRMFPAARFLVMARNPLEMLPSWHARVLFTMDE